MKIAAFRTLVLLAAAVLAGWITPAVRAQSDSELRQENQALTTRVSELEKELEAARRQIEDLQEQLAKAREQLMNQGSRPSTAPAAEPPLEPEEVSIDESVPTASPRALLTALRASYQKETEGLDIGKPGDGKRRAYVKRLEGWKATSERENRKPITWRVEVLEDRSGERERALKVQAVDPQTGTVLGDPFEVTLNKLQADRLTEQARRGDAIGWDLKGTLVPAIRINQNRAEAGLFDKPRFVGPFAEMDFTVDVSSIIPVRQETPEGSETGNGRKSDRVPPAQPAAPAQPAKPAGEAEKP